MIFLKIIIELLNWIIVLQDVSYLSSASFLIARSVSIGISSWSFAFKLYFVRILPSSTAILISRIGLPNATRVTLKRRISRFENSLPDLLEQTCFIYKGGIILKVDSMEFLLPSQALDTLQDIAIGRWASSPWLIKQIVFFHVLPRSQGHFSAEPGITLTRISW